MKKFIIGLSLLMLAFNANVNAENSDFIIKIPYNWVEIPREILAQYSQALRESTGSGETHEYGYQLSTADNWFTYPYALVQLKRGTRIPEEQLEQYKQLESVSLDGSSTTDDYLQEIVSNTSQGETLYEPGKQILWSVFSMDVANIGQVNGVIAIKLTEYGFIQFVGYASEEEFSKYLPLYQSMIESIELSEEDRYKPATMAINPVFLGIDLKQTAIAAIIGLLIAGAFGLLLKLRRKRS